MDNVNKRNLMSEIGDAFRNWTSVYLSEESEKLDTLISRPDAFEDYKKVSGGKTSANSFKKAMKAYCKFKGYILNPKELEPKGSRIIKKLNGRTQEFFYIKTKEKVDFLSMVEDNIENIDTHGLQY